VHEVVNGISKGWPTAALDCAEIIESLGILRSRVNESDTSRIPPCKARKDSRGVRVFRLSTAVSERNNRTRGVNIRRNEKHDKSIAAPYAHTVTDWSCSSVLVMSGPFGTVAAVVPVGSPASTCFEFSCERSRISMLEDMVQRLAS